MERMSTLDAGFYFLENENTPMHVGSVSVFEGPAPSYGDVVRLLVSKLPKVPRYRQRVRAVPLHIGRPAWVDDEPFEVLYPVRHTAGRLVAAAGAVDAAAVAGGAARRVRCAAAAAGPGTGAGPQRPEPGPAARLQPGAAGYRPEPGRGDRPLAERLPRTAPALGVDA